MHPYHLPYRCRRLRPKGAIARRMGAALAAWATVGTASAGINLDLDLDEVSKVYNAAVYYRYHIAIGRPVQAACYVDFTVPGSMSCTAATGPKGAGGSQLRNAAKRQATKQCKAAGGNGCRLFWRSGELKTDRLAGEARERLQALFEYSGSYEAQGAPLPEGASLGQLVRDRFANASNQLETYRVTRDGGNAHYGICANEAGFWSVFLAEGEGVERSHVRNLCVLKCDGLAKWVSAKYPALAGKCYAVYENGEFVSETAKKALIDE